MPPKTKKKHVHRKGRLKNYGNVPFDWCSCGKLIIEVPKSAVIVRK